MQFCVGPNEVGVALCVSRAYNFIWQNISAGQWLIIVISRCLGI